MSKSKLLIIIVLLFGFSTMKGQNNESVLDRINFNDERLIGSDILKNTITEYMTMVQNASKSQTNPNYNLILAADNIMSRCYSSYQMYKFVYQYLIYGFSEMGANAAVDYMVGLPYFQYLNANAMQANEMLKIAESYNRVKIGSKAADIDAVTLKNYVFELYAVEAKYTILLFWSYSCPHCRNLVNELGKFVKKRKDIAVVTVNVSGDLVKVKRLLRKSHLKKQYNIYENSGWNSEIVDDYAVDMTPSLFLLDADKIIIAKPFDIEEITNFVDE